MPRPAKPHDRRDADLGARFTASERLRVERASKRTGASLSDFIREAVLESAERVLDDAPTAAFAEAIGAIDVPGDYGRRGEAVYTDLLLEKHAPGARRTRKRPPP